MEQTFTLWKDEKSTKIHFLPAENKKGNGTVIVFAGGAYIMRASHEDVDYCKELNRFGLNVFFVDYRVAPNRFPLPQLDARRSVRFVRANAEKFGIDPNKIAVLGSSAGGHLVASLCTYRPALEGEGVDEIDQFDYLPNAQILVYPVITLSPDFTHIDSAKNLLGDNYPALCDSLSAEMIADEMTPPTFIWHTADDSVVPVKNSLVFAQKLQELNIPFELHVFPHGRHGLGLAKDFPEVSIWSELLRRWLIGKDWFQGNI